MGKKIDSKIKKAKKKLEAAKSALLKYITSKDIPGPDERDVEPTNYLQTSSEDQKVPLSESAIKTRRTLKGHFGKIYALQWGSDNKHAVSASQDGKLVVWNCDSTNKVFAIPLKSAWVMSCAFSPSEQKDKLGNLCASGGLDNICTIYQIPALDEYAEPKMCGELNGHEGYLSCSRFIDNTQIMTSSGDRSCILWDVQSKKSKSCFLSHSADVMSLAIDASSNHMITGSCDKTAKYWDIRTGKVIHTFYGHDSDINSVQFFPGYQAFGTASDDSTIRLWDLRSYRQVNAFAQDKIQAGITSMDFSGSGKFAFGGYDDAYCRVWDVRLAEELEQLEGHEMRVSCLGVANDGKALLTGSWDTFLKVWA